MRLPDACEHCAADGGFWVIGESGGVRRCSCARGLALSGATSTSSPMPPVIPSAEATIFVEMMTGMAYFPSEEGFRMAVGDEIRSMCRSQQEALWLVTRLNRLYDRWPGIPEMRRVYCSSGRQPLDGVDCIGISPIYPEGIPVESVTRQAAIQIRNDAPLKALDEVKDPEARKALSSLMRRREP